MQLFLLEGGSPRIACHDPHHILYIRALKKLSSYYFLTLKPLRIAQKPPEESPDVGSPPPDRLPGHPSGGHPEGGIHYPGENRPLFELIRTLNQSFLTTSGPHF